MTLCGGDTVVNCLPVVRIKKANEEHVRLAAARVDIDSCESSRRELGEQVRLAEANWRDSERQLANRKTELQNMTDNYNSEKKLADGLQGKNDRLAKVWKSLSGVAAGLFLGGLGLGIYIAHH